jgi:hypothetical protein
MTEEEIAAVRLRIDDLYGALLQLKLKEIGRGNQDADQRLSELRTSERCDDRNEHQGKAEGRRPVGLPPVRTPDDIQV